MASKLVVVDVLDITVGKVGIETLKVLVRHPRAAMEKKQSLGWIAAAPLRPDFIFAVRGGDGYHSDFCLHEMPPLGLDDTSIA